MIKNKNWKNHIFLVLMLYTKKIKKNSQKTILIENKIFLI